MKSSECYPNGTCHIHETYSRTDYLKNSKCGCPLGYNKPYVPEDIQNGDMKDCEKWCENNANNCVDSSGNNICKYCCWGLQKCETC